MYCKFILYEMLAKALYKNIQGYENLLYKYWLLMMKCFFHPCFFNTTRWVQRVLLFRALYVLLYITNALPYNNINFSISIFLPITHQISSQPLLSQRYPLKRYNIPRSHLPEVFLLIESLLALAAVLLILELQFQL